MNTTRNPSQQQTKAVNQVVKQLQPTISVTKEQRLADLVVRLIAALEATTVD
jgi:hypothetical protein